MKLFRLLLLFPLLLTACSFSLAGDVTPPPGSEQTAAPQAQAVQVSGPLYPLVAPNPQDGAPIYTDKCAACHGVAGKGDGPQAVQLPNPVAAVGSPDVARESTPSQWYAAVTQGNIDRYMPPFNSLSDRQRWDVVAYLYSLSAPAEQVAKGEQLYQANCAQCHGNKGQGNGPDATSLSTKPIDFTDQAQMANKSENDFFAAITKGVPPDMPAFGQLSEADRWALSDYLRSLTFAAPANPAAAAQGTQGAAGAGSSASAGAAQAAPTEVATQAVGLAQATTEAAASVTASAQTVGTITGKVTNGSGGELPSDLVITLHGFDQTQSVITDTTKLKPDGTFEFKDVQMESGLSFLTAATYGQATYASDVASVQPNVANLSLPITIYDTTTDPSVLSADRLHLFFEFVDPKTVRVIELYILTNTSNRTLIAAKQGQPTVTFQLPQGATNLQFQDGTLGDGHYIETQGGFGDTSAIPPGTGIHQELFAFEMPYDRKLDLNQPVSMAVDAVVRMVPEGGIKVKGNTLADAGTRDVQGTSYHTYNGSNLSAGQNLSLTMTGNPSGSGAILSSVSNRDLAIGLGGFGLALILAGVWLWNRSRRGPADFIEDEPSDDLDNSHLEDPDTLMDAILTLDDQYQAGQLSEEAYQQRREELKARLKEIMG